MSEVQTLYGHEEWSNKKPRTQVFLATHDGADRRLPHRERSFISFTYGGKFIEDFSLIATVRGDRMERQLYGDFSDNTSTYDVIDGQFYWGTHFTTNKLELQLSTDEITEQELQDFKSWFRPGEGRELILAEYPNRAIWARINKPPEYHVLPFEKKVKSMFAGRLYEISTTVYRGDIDLEFVMDDPFWYSIYNVLPSYGQDGAADWFKTLGIGDMSNEELAAANNSLISNKDYLKVILEDGAPTKEMFQINQPVITGDQVHNIQKKPIAGGNGYEGAKVGIARLISELLQLVKKNDNSASAYLYYTGSAPAPTIISFDLIPAIEDGYICQPWNKIYNKVANNSGKEETPANYNKIIIGKQEFDFTTPSLYTGYNQALDIVSSVPEGTSTIDLHILLNDGVNEYYSRSWALGILNYLKAFQIGVDLKTSQINNKAKFLQYFSSMMKKFLEIRDRENEDDSDEEPKYIIKPASFVFNSKNGLSTGTFMIRKFNDDGLSKWDELSLYKEQWNIRLKIREQDILDAIQIFYEDNLEELTNENNQYFNAFYSSDDDFIIFSTKTYLINNKTRSSEETINILLNYDIAIDSDMLSLYNLLSSLNLINVQQGNLTDALKVEYAKDYIIGLQKYVSDVNEYQLKVISIPISDFEAIQYDQASYNSLQEPCNFKKFYKIANGILSYNIDTEFLGNGNDIKTVTGGYSALRYLYKEINSNESINYNRIYDILLTWGLITENNSNKKQAVKDFYTDLYTTKTNLAQSINQFNNQKEYVWILFNAGFDMLDPDGNYLFTVKPFMDYTEEYQVTENVGDMVYSKYLYLNEKNLYNSQGFITENECTPITTDYPSNTGGLQNFDIQYKYMYL